MEKRTVTLELTNEDAKAFYEKCYMDDTSPAEVLEGFINDLINGTYTRGSDERTLARDYYTRCGYGIFTAHKPFTRFLLEIHGIDSLEEITDALDDMADVDGYPEDERGAMLEECKGIIGEYYQEYTRHEDNPESLEDGLKGVRDYMGDIESIMKGGGL